MEYLLQDGNESKLTILEYVKLLKENNKEARCEFIMKFIPIIRNLVNGIYADYKDFLDGSYDYEDLFCDAIVIAMKLYDSGRYNDGEYQSFIKFRYLFIRRVSNLLVNTCGIKVDPKTGFQIIKVLRAYRDFVLSEKRVPSISELQKLTNLTEHRISNAIIFESEDSLKGLTPSFEDEVIDYMYYEKMHNDLMNALMCLNDSEQEMACDLTGFNGHELLNQNEVAKKNNVSRQAVAQKQKNVFKKVLKNNNELEGYRYL